MQEHAKHIAPMEVIYFGRSVYLFIFDPETISRNRPKYVAAFPTILTMIVDTGLRATDS